MNFQDQSFKEKYIVAELELSEKFEKMEKDKKVLVAEVAEGRRKITLCAKELRKVITKSSTALLTHDVMYVEKVTNDLVNSSAEFAALLKNHMHKLIKLKKIKDLDSL